MNMTRSQQMITTHNMNKELKQEHDQESNLNREEHQFFDKMQLNRIYQQMNNFQAFKSENSHYGGGGSVRHNSNLVSKGTQRRASMVVHSNGNRNGGDKIVKTSFEDTQQDQNLYDLDESKLKHNLYKHVCRQELERIRMKFRHFQIFPEQKQNERLLVCFWLAIHLEQLVVVKFLYERFEFIQIVIQKIYESAEQNREQIYNEIKSNKLQILYDKYEKDLPIKNKACFQNLNKMPDNFKDNSKINVKLEFVSQEIQEVLKSKQALDYQKRLLEERGEIQAYLSEYEEKYVREKARQIKTINKKRTIKELKILLMTSIGRQICKDVLDIALNDEEEGIACTIVMLYSINISKKEINRAITINGFNFIQAVLSSVQCNYVIQGNEDFSHNNRNYNSMNYNHNIQQNVSNSNHLHPNHHSTISSNLINEVQDIVLLLLEQKEDYIDYLQYGKNMSNLAQRQQEAYRQTQQVSQAIREILLGWHKVQIDTNLIKFILRYDLEDIACECINKNNDLLTTETMKEAILSHKEEFVKHCLQKGLMDSHILNDHSLINVLISNLKKRDKVFFTFNLLLFCNLAKWQFSQIKELEQNLKEIVINEYEKNLITVVHNPILIVVFSCELLSRIGKNYRLLSNDCQNVREKLIILVQKLIEHYDDPDTLQEMLNEQDFKKRTTLSIIMAENMPQMVISSKVNTIMNEMWDGKESFKCNGRISDFSILFSRLLEDFSEKMVVSYDYMGRKIISRDTNFIDVIMGSFTQPKITSERYWFQYQNRHRSINYMYYKEFIQSFLMVSIFEYISYSYLSYFKQQNLEESGYVIQHNYEDNDEGLILLVQQQIDSYKLWSLAGLGMCAAIYLHFFQKFLFSVITKQSLPFDIWSRNDIITAACNTFCLYVTGTITPRDILTALQKQKLDFYVCTVVTITWFRFFAYFLLIKPVSKQLITLYEILENTIAFIFIIVCELVVAGVIFQMRFGVIAPNKYGTTILAARTLFDGLVADFHYTDLGNFDDAHTALMIVHLIIAHIFLFNFLVAVLSTVYRYMINQGEYSYLKFHYLFYQKYELLFSVKSSENASDTHSDKLIDEQTEKRINNKNILTQDNSYICEIAMQSPPFNIIAVIFTPLLVLKPCRPYLMEKLSKTIYWTENMIYLVLFLVFELVLVPFLYIKIFIAYFIIIGTKPRAMVYPLIWLIGGLPILMYLAFKDCFNLFKILATGIYSQRIISRHNKQVEKDHIQQAQINILNEVITSMKYLFKQVEVAQQKTPIRQNLSRQDLKKFRRKSTIIKRLSSIRKNAMKNNANQFSFALDKEYIIMGWLRFRQNRLVTAESKQKGHKSNFGDQIRVSQFQNSQSQMNFAPYSNLMKRSMITSTNLINASKTNVLSQNMIQKVLQQAENRRGSQISTMQVNKQYSNLHSYIQDLNIKQNQRQQRVTRRYSVLSRKSKRGALRLGSILSNLAYNQGATAAPENLSEKDDEYTSLKKNASVDMYIIAVVENFLSRFMFVSKRQGHNQVHLKLSIKAVPSILTMKNFYRVQMINFVRVQMALVAFQNSHIDQLFNYFDQRNKARINTLKQQADETEYLSKSIQAHSSKIRNKLTKLFKIEHDLRREEGIRKKEQMKQEEIQQQQKIALIKKVQKSRSTIQHDLYPVAEENENESKQDELFPPSPSRMKSNQYSNVVLHHTMEQLETEVLEEYRLNGGGGGVSNIYNGGATGLVQGGSGSSHQLSPQDKMLLMNSGEQPQYDDKSKEKTSYSNKSLSPYDWSDDASAYSNDSFSSFSDVQDDGIEGIDDISVNLNRFVAQLEEQKFHKR